ncbi:MAG: type II CAAX endopeptidase family protein [Pseudomonadota bacterium]
MRDVVVILISAVILRAFAGVLILSIHGEYPLFASMLVQVLFYFLLIVLSIKIFKLNARQWAEFAGEQPGIRGIGFAILWAIGCVAFEFGQNAMEAWVLSQFDRNFAKFWLFQESPRSHFPIEWSFFFCKVAIGALIAPVVEEFFFRGVMLRALIAKNGFFVAALISSIIFTMLHFNNRDYISTFIFGFSLCYIFSISRSLLVCVIIHSAYNFIVFVGHFYVDWHFLRSVGQDASVSDWSPQMWMYGFSILLMASFAFKFRAAIANARLTSIRAS